MWYSGIDQHKQYCVITTYGPDGPRVKQARVASTPLALQGTSPSSPARIVYHVLTKQEDFNGQFKQRPLSRQNHTQWPRRASPPAQLTPARGSRACLGSPASCQQRIGDLW